MLAATGTSDASWDETESWIAVGAYRWEELDAIQDDCHFDLCIQCFSICKRQCCSRPGTESAGPASARAIRAGPATVRQPCGSRPATNGSRHSGRGYDDTRHDADDGTDVVAFPERRRARPR